VTVLVQDSFTDTDATSIEAHAPEVGSGYALVHGTSAGEAHIESGRLKHLFGDNGPANFYNLTALPTNEIAIEVTLRFVDDAFCELELTRNGTDYGNPDKFVILDFFSSGNASITSQNETASLNSVLTALNTDYVLRVEFTEVAGDTQITYFIDDVQVMQDTMSGTWFDGALGFNVWDSTGVSAMRVDDLLVETLEDVPPEEEEPSEFWTAFVGSHEVI
jgi:hypothetical protein